MERSCHFLHDSCYLAEVSSYSSEPSDTQLSLREGEMGREYTRMVLQEVVAPTHTTFEGTSWARSHAIWLATCLYQDHVHWTMAIWLAIRLYQDHIGPWPSGWLYVCTKITLDHGHLAGYMSVPRSHWTVLQICISVAVATTPIALT